MSPMIKLGRWTFAVALAAALCGGAASAQTPLKFSLDWKFEGPAAPFLLALDKGYYKAGGLDVAVDPGNGSLAPIERVASGAYEMGFADINSLIKYRDANPSKPLKAVFIVYNKPPFAIIGRKSRGILAPKNLEGRRLGAPATDGAFAQWKVFVEANKLDASKVQIENVAFAVREPMLANGQVDAVAGFSFTSYFDLKDKGVPVEDISVLLMADYGVHLYGNAIIVNPKFAAENPAAVKAFLAAFVRALKDTAKNPDAAVTSVLSRNDVVKKDIEAGRLKMALKDNILTPEVMKDGIGGADMERLQRSIEQLGLTYTFKAKPAASDIFDASFLPPAADRKM